MGALSRLRQRREARAAEREESAVRLILALAVLLEAGATPAVAWRCLAEDAGDEAVAARVVAAWSSGAAEAIAEASDDEWSLAALAATWRVAETVGAPLAPVLRAMAEVLTSVEECRGDVQVALAEPKSAVRLMAFLPLVGVAMGAGMGFGTLEVLLTNPVGIACAIAGCALMFLARRWSGRLVANAQPRALVPGLRGELLAIALSSGASVARAERVVEEALAIHLGENDEPDDTAESVLELSRRAGVPAVELLRSGAQFERHEYRVTAKASAAELSAKLLFPLGACTLPAFLLLGVAPMVLSVLGATLH